MGKKAFRLRLPEQTAVERTVAEFPVPGPSEARRMGRRALVLGALAGVPQKPRTDLAKAVAEACRLFSAAQLPATIRFGIAEQERQSLIEVVITAMDRTNPDARSFDGEQHRSKLQQLGRALLRCELHDFPGPDAQLVLAQAAPATLRTVQQELADWEELLDAPTPEDAVARAQRRRHEATSELGIVRAHGAGTEGSRDATADRDDLETLSLIVSRATNAILITDPIGTAEWSNEAFTELTGYPRAAVVGQRVDQLLFGPSTAVESVRDFQRALRNGHELTLEVMQYHRDGRKFWAECKLVPVHDDRGQLARWIVIQSDVTRRKQTEEALRTAKQAAETSSRAKSEFLANMSHEIRTPLNAILGMTELALTTDLSREQREYLRSVQSSADTLLQLLNDVLDISKIESGRMEIEEIGFNLAETVRDTLKALAVKAHEKGLELAVHMPLNIPQYLEGDPTRIRQVLFNLVGNAIKFTERGEVAVDVEEQWRTDEDVCLHFAVRDTGIGIPKDRLQKIFESFAQVDASIARRFGGTGLGLTITSQLVQMMNGKIWVQSTVGQGSVFHFTVQLKIGQKPTTAAPVAIDASHLENRLVLVVDDSSANRRILEEMLGQWGMRPTLADGAATALKELENAARRDEPFDLVLLDVIMPTVDGFQLAEMVAQRPDLKCETFLMLSSADRPNSAQRCRQLGGTYLVKPVSASVLLEAILTALAGKTEPTRQNKPLLDDRNAEAPKPQRTLEVLVADDHEPNRNLAMKILERRGHRCTAASDGAEAITACAQHQFDAVLMDVQMPTLDGFSATRRIREREQPTGSHVPIIALTAHALAGDREKCLAAGMDAYLAKPLHARELVALVERITGVHRNGNDHSASRSGPVRTVAFDISAALERMGGEMDLLSEHIGYVLSDLPELLDRMRQAIQQQDSRLLEISAHRLKSLVGSYNHEQARELAQTLEQMGRDGRLAEASDALRKLEPLITEFIKAVKYYRELACGDE